MLYIIITRTVGLWLLCRFTEAADLSSSLCRFTEAADLSSSLCRFTEAADLSSSLCRFTEAARLSSSLCRFTEAADLLSPSLSRKFCVEVYASFINFHSFVHASYK